MVVDKIDSELKELTHHRPLHSDMPPNDLDFILYTLLFLSVSILPDFQECDKKDHIQAST